MNQSKSARRKAQNERKRAAILERLLPKFAPIEEGDRVRVTFNSPLFPLQKGDVLGFVTQHGQEYVRVRLPNKRGLIIKLDRCHVEKLSPLEGNVLLKEQQANELYAKRVFEFDGLSVSAFDKWR